MGWAGLVLVIIGFALVLPKGGMPGSTAHRNVPMGSFIYQTAGHRDGDDGRSKSWKTAVIGVALMAAGLGIMALSA
ncbi:MAG: hypothetical protein HZB15_04845 [Actinobacteria bacterium]|nr:hypothetical protein [Actinomycetota bacterium]